jgi:hypothetical protein
MTRRVHMRRWGALGAVAAIALLAGSASAQGKKPKKPAPKPAPTEPAKPKPGAAAPSVDTTKPRAVEVTVAEVAGGQAFVQPGSKAGIHRGSTVLLGGKEYKVLQSSESFAVVDVGEDAVREKEKGHATVVAEVEDQPVVLPPPKPLSTFTSAWTEEEPPASQEHPKFVPLGSSERDKRFDARLTLSGGGLIPIGNQVGAPLGFGELDARLHAEPFRIPLAFDGDASVQEWGAADLASRVGGSSRPTLWVRELLASYASGGWYAGVGRMRYASSTLGALDGVRVAAPLGQGFSIGAFGGLLPNPLSGQLSSDAERFGIEAKFNRPDLAVRPEAALVVHGSVFGGGLDERRISGMFAIYPGLARFGGHFEVSNFDSNNPWKLSAVELTAAGLDQSVRIGPVEIGLRGDLLQPERSKWLASFLPVSWFCTTVPAATAAKVPVEPCDGNSETRVLGTVDAGISIDRYSLMLGGTALGDLTQNPSSEHMFGGFATARVVRLAKYFRVEASGNYSAGSYMNMFGFSAGPGVTLFKDAVDVSAYFRLAELEYASVNTSLQQDAVGGTILFFPSSVWMAAVQSEAIAGDDVHAIFLFGTLTFRPRF